jgi:hypothetical protein
MSETTTEVVEQLAFKVITDMSNMNNGFPFRGEMAASVQELGRTAIALAARVAELKAENARLRRSRDRYREEWEHAKAHQEVAATRAVARAALQKDKTDG